MNFEEYFENLAKIQNKDVLLVCDRGACDTFAYCTSEVKNEVLKKNDWNENFLNHDRYDKIIHLVSAANGAEEFFTLENEARSEGIKEARRLDSKIQEVWFNNPRYVIIDNSNTSFVQKIDKVFAEIGSVVSLPTSRFVRKFLLKNFFEPSQFDKDIQFCNYQEKVIYLPKTQNDTISFIIKRTYDTFNKIMLTYKTRYLTDIEEKRVETSKQITDIAFEGLFNQRDTSKREITKNCYTFRMEHQDQVFIYKIENFMLEEANFSVLHLSSDKAKKTRQFPEFVDIVREITEESDFFTHVLAKKKLSTLE